MPSIPTVTCSDAGIDRVRDCLRRSHWQYAAPVRALMPLDFASAVDLFSGTEQELAMALGIDVGDLRHFRTNPQRATPALLARMGRVLVERGNGMRRVGEMLMEEGE